MKIIVDCLVWRGYDTTVHYKMANNEPEKGAEIGDWWVFTNP